MAKKIIYDPTHFLHAKYDLLPSGRWHRMPAVRTQRAMKSFLPSSYRIIERYVTTLIHFTTIFISIVLIIYPASLFNFNIISTFDCIYFITTVFYGQPFICLILLCRPYVMFLLRPFTVHNVFPCFYGPNRLLLL